MNKDINFTVQDMIKSRPGEPLTTKRVVKEIQMIMNDTQKGGGKLHIKS
jgi:hypothetical protein